jgi:glutaredoxin
MIEPESIRTPVSAEGAEEPRLALYYSQTCGYCWRVQRVIDELKIPVELRDIWEKPAYLAELHQARRRSTVPVLRIEAPNGSVTWMPESRDIIRYLQGVAGSNR